MQQPHSPLPTGPASGARRPGTTGPAQPGRVLALLAASLLVAGLLGGCKGVLDPQGPVARAELSILTNATAIMLAVILPVIVMTLAFAWWFRAGNARAQYRPDWDYSGRIELVVWSVPALTVLFLGGIGWIGSHILDPHAPIQSDVKPIEIQVVSLDWKWLFIYPEQGIASVNRLVVPAGTPLSFTLTSASVMNSFFVPQLGSQIYVMAGMTTHLNLMADNPGTFAGLSAMFSGDGFSDMHFDVVAMGKDGFEGWAARAREAGNTLDEGAYDAFSKPGLAEPGKTFGQVSPDLFKSVADGRTAPPGTPQTDRPDVHSEHRADR